MGYACGNRMDPYREMPVPSALCPRCNIGLVRRMVGDAHVEECRLCAGIFVAIELIPRVVDALDLGGEVMVGFPPTAPAAVPGTIAYRKCPRCSNLMNRKLFATGAKVIVDICRQHGIWFDDAELRAVAVFAAGGGMERAAIRDADERKQRAQGPHRSPPPTWLAGLVESPAPPVNRSLLLELVVGLLTFWR
jgi:Zn-finger nucleic acid-binding protein